MNRSRQCLLDRGIDSTIFAYPYDRYTSNSKVVKKLSEPPSSMHRDYSQNQASNAADYRDFANDGKSHRD